MKIVIRADASVEIGTGHVMRCLALADGLKRRGADVSIISREGKGNLIELAEEKGYNVHRLPAGIAMDEDRESTKKILSKEHADWLVVDHYDIDISWEASMRPYIKKIMVIDDLAQKRHDCDLLLNQNYFSEGRYEGLVPDGCIRLIGPRYALLRPQFLNARGNLKERTGEVKRIFVFMGGTDPLNETLKVLKAVRMLNRPDIAVDVVTSSSSLHKAGIEAIASGMQNTVCHFDVEDMAGLMAQADLSIGAGGTATWERCSLGLPSLVITIAENQVNITERLAEDGYIIYAGRNNEVNDASLSEDLRFLLRHPEILRQLSRRCLGLVDGSGTGRVADHILEAPEAIRLRPARAGDARMVFEWRNHPDVRRQSFDPSPLNWDLHEKWFLKTVSSEETALLIAEGEGWPIGVLRYDLRKDEALVSVYVKPTLMGMGYGASILKAGSEWIKKNRPGVNRLVAEIKKGNVSSIKAFEKAGFMESHLTYVFEFDKMIR